MFIIKKPLKIGKHFKDYISPIFYYFLHQFLTLLLLVLIRRYAASAGTEWSRLSVGAHLHL